MNVKASAPNRGVGHRIVGSISAYFAKLKDWRDGTIGYRELSKLSDRQLRDIGVERCDLERICFRNRS
jgi:uncharacterized protein YjiS (DUF1127 family)